MQRSSESSGGNRRLVTCPACGGDSLYAPSNPFRPFCSERCKKIDLGAWANEAFRMPTDAPPDHQEFGDPRKTSTG